MSVMAISKLPVMKQVTYSEVKQLMDSEGLNVSQIAKRLDISTATVNQLLHHKGNHGVKWNEENVALLKDAVNEGMKCAEIAETFGTSVGAIRVAISKFGFSKKRNVKKAEKVEEIDIPTPVREPYPHLEAEANEVELTKDNFGEFADEPSTATAWLKEANIRHFDGKTQLYVVDFDSGSVYAQVGARNIYLADRRDLLTMARELMAIEQLFVSRERKVK